MSNRNHAPVRTHRRGSLLISTDQSLLDLQMIHHFLAEESYWARGESAAIIRKAVTNSLCYAIYNTAGDKPAQLGLARVITDFATYAYLTDVFILPEFRGRGLGKWLIACILQNPDFESLRIFSLYTADAHTLYTPFGFTPNPQPANHLIIRPREQEATDAALSDS